MAITVGVVRETIAGENRVALIPAVVSKLVNEDVSVVIEKGAGVAAGYSDADYEAVGAKPVTAKQALAADLVVTVRRPEAKALAGLKKGQVLLGLLDSRVPAELTDAADKGVHVLSLDRLPRQLSRAQSMDALTSQASIAGYRAVIVAAEAFARYFPMMVTAAGTAKPAKILVLGAGVAGLQAIGTARRLGAQVTGYDVRPAAREEVVSMGAQFLKTSVETGAGEGGYARKLTDEEAAAQRAELATAIAGFDIVITTAQVPGAKPPVLVTKDVVANLKAGSVVVDMAASELGGNVEGSAPDERVTTKNGVIIIGGNSLAAQMGTGASEAYARNIAAVFALLNKDGELVIDAEDEVVGALLLNEAAPKDVTPVNDDDQKGQES